LDERTDLVRSVRDQQFIYIRNFLPHRIYGQYLNYMFQTPTTRVWRQLYDQGKLKPPQTYFWEPKPSEELYDLNADRWEVNNLAAAPAHKATLERLRAALHESILQTRDVGFLPEGEIHSRATDSSAYEYGHDQAKYPLERILETAELASNGSADAAGELDRRLSDANSAVRYCAAPGLLERGQKAPDAQADALRKGLQDESPYVRSVAGEALGKFGSEADLKSALDTLIALADVRKNDVYIAMAALQAIDNLGAKAMPLKDRIAALPQKNPATVGRMQEYVPRLLEHIGQTLGLKISPAASGDGGGGDK
jgi:uncharacterized sulfatase